MTLGKSLYLPELFPHGMGLTPEYFLDEQTLERLLTTQIPGSPPRSAESESLGGEKEGRGYALQQRPPR